MKINKKTILIICAAVTAAALLTVIISVSAKQKPLIWYVDEGLEKKWEQILTSSPPQSSKNLIQVWDSLKLPDNGGILISFKPWVETQEKVKVFHRLSWDLEYEGAHVIAVDPWMIFNKHTNPPLTSEMIYSNTKGAGSILIPGRDTQTVHAWTSRFIQERPGQFPQGNDIWKEWESKLFDLNIFASGTRGYDWHAVFFRLMSSEQAWIYAPVSAVRGYRDPRKSILQASAFPYSGSDENSLLVKILWALPVDSKSKRTQKSLENTMNWLKTPEIQTIIANNLDIIPADPYGTPYDPASLTAHRLWLTSVWIYSIYE